MAKKGDLVVLQVTRTAHFINPYRSETHSEFTVVRVASATREGIVKSVKEIGYGLVRKLDHMTGNPRIHCMPNHQEHAQRLINSRTQDEWKSWDSIESIRSAILSA